MEKQKITTSLSIDTKTIYERLCKANGETVTYDELSALIGRNVQFDAHYVLSAARRKALRENQIAFGVVRGEGLKRLNDREKVGAGEAFATSIRRKARNGARVVAAVEKYEDLGDVEKVRHNAYLTVFAMAEHVTKTKQIQKIEGKVQQAGRALPLAKTLEAFQGGIGSPA